MSASRRCGSSYDELLEQLAALCDGPAITFRIGRDGARIVQREGRTLLFRRTGGRQWKRVTRSGRMLLVLGWIREAAAEREGRFQPEKKGAA